MTDTDGGLHLRPRDMAKLGQLYLDGGVWGGSRVVSESWVRESVQEHMVTEGQPNNGYLWWCGDFHYADRSAFAVLASGHGGQKIYVFPELDMVVVLTHAVFDNPMGATTAPTAGCRRGRREPGPVRAHSLLPGRQEDAGRVPRSEERAANHPWRGAFRLPSRDETVVRTRGGGLPEPRSGGGR